MPKSKALTWTTIKTKLGDLIEYDKNPVQITEREAKELSKSLLKFNNVIPYVAAAPPNGTKAIPLLDGHQRKLVSIQINKVSASTMVEVRVPSRKLTEKEKQELIIRLRKNTGEFDYDKLENFFDVPDLLDWGFTEKELLGAGFEFGDETKDAEPQIDRAAELLKKWKVKTGDLWQIGEHRLICGSSADDSDVARLLDNEPIDLVLTDPPYAVGYAAKNRALQTIGPSNRLTTDIEGDTLSTEETAEQLWSPVFENAYNHARNGAVIYSFSPQGGDQMMMMMMMRAKWNDRLHQLIWRKNSPTFSMGRLDYQYQHEPVLYTWKGTNHGYYGETGRSVIDCDRPSASKLHPTMKPVELFEIFIRNSSKEGEIVYEPFSGSGTTLVACQNLHRRGRAIEISPAYCAVTLQRMRDAFPDIEIKRIK